MIGSCTPKYTFSILSVVAILSTFLTLTKASNASSMLLFGELLIRKTTRAVPVLCQVTQRSYSSLKHDQSFDKSPARKVLKMGDPALYEKAAAVQDPSNPVVEQTVQELLKTLEATGTFMGLSAPQIGIPLRIAYFRIPKESPNPRYHLTTEFDPEGVPPTILVNPVIEPLSDEMALGYETCLSVPGMVGIVKRHQSIRYTWDTPEGKKSRVAHGFHARLVQHECGHLDGILYPQLIEDLRHFGYQDVLFARNLI